jgi:hypothetical protein
MSSSALLQIEKLDDSNYETWKVQMEAVLVYNDFWGYIDGSIKAVKNEEEK